MKGIEQFVQVDAATLGALKYAGTWNASTNTPTLASGVGVQGQYYVVSVAGTTNLDGVTNWGVGDWAVFNGTVWQRVEGGADGNFVNLSVTGTATVSGTAEFADGLAASPSITNIGDTNTGMYFPSADAIGIVTGGVNRVRVTSTGDVGIGTTSPGEKLQVAGAIRATGAVAANTTGGILAYQGSSTVMLGSWGADASTYGAIQFYQANSTGTINRTGMLLDSAGNLGLGVTPSAWVGQTAIQFPALAALSAGWDYVTYLSQNAYRDSGTWKYMQSSLGAAAYGQGGATHAWFIAPSGTAGNAISFTQAMTLDASGSLLVGQTSNISGKLQISGAGGIRINEDGAGTKVVFLRSDYAGLGPSIQVSTTDPLLFLTSNTERMRIDSSGNVGIGTSSPAYKLDVLIGAGSGSLFRAGQSGVSNGYTITSNGSALTHFWATTGEAMRLDSSGNLGLGVTPSAWSTNRRALQIGGGDVAALGLAAQYSEIAHNTISTVSGPQYATSNPAAVVDFNNAAAGGFAWRIAPSGTAGNAISFTQAMTLDASGDLIVGGTTTNSIRLTAEKSNPTRGIIAHVSNTGSSGLTGSQLMFTQNTVNNWAVGQPAGVDAFAFWSGRNTAADGTERMRIDASGNLLVGKTTASGTTVGPELLANGQINTATANLDNLNIYNTTAAAYRFYVNAAGTVFATNTTISAISDQRLKENVQDLDAGLDKIMALKPRKFDWKAGKGKDIKGDRGFIAQEFEQVFPDLIDEWKDQDEGEDPYKSVRQDLIPVLVKAIQELKAEVDSLKAQLGA